MAAGDGEEHYDDSAFIYFALSVLVIILIPSTMYYVKIWKKALSNKYNGICRCNDCVSKAKKLQILSRKPSAWGIGKFVLYLLVIFLFLFLLRNAAQAKTTETVQFDPYQILELDYGAGEEDIKKAYRKLTLKYHPDKNKEEGAAEKFILVSKAHDTLTDPEIREKCEKYGNPDGPQGLSVGIALPKFLVEGKNNLLVLGVYILFLVVIFPTIAICYWQKQKAVAHNQLMNKTMQLFYQATNENMRFKKLIEVFAAAFEYKDFIPVRSTDGQVLQQLQPLIPDIEDKEKKVHKTKRKVLVPHILKNVMLFYGHFSREHAVMAPLMDDVDALVKQFHHLVIGMAELTVQAWDVKTRQPRRWLTPITEAIYTSQMVTQAVWSDRVRMGRDTDIFQIPHMSSKLATKLANKKYRIESAKEFAQLNHEKRRSILLEEGLTEEQIQDIDNVCKILPYDVDMKYKCEVDEDDETVGITGGSIVNLIATFSRPSTRDPKKDSSEQEEASNRKEGENVTLVKKDASTPKSDNKKTDTFQPPKTKDEDLIEVHAPFFPERKNELWWLIITDERRVVGITRIASLKDGTEARIPFQAPAKAGTYAYTIKLMSDSYTGFDLSKTFKMKVEKELPYKEPEYKEEENEEEELVPEEHNTDNQEDEDSVGSEEEN